ncbi:MAG: aminotransferase class V-fold PLP-dependent enzyme [Deltaproteobacteria bacterium]|nr:MAG: aminotransferase class V-fold PLP-dependent enzyme [Deltaproteobacteria bacterium]
MDKPIKNISKYVKDFPILKKMINNCRLVYLDSASTCFKPLSVINLEKDYSSQFCANIHRGVHTLSEEATDLFEKSRESAQSFLNAKFKNEIIFTSGTTFSINLIANSFVQKKLKPGDEILISSFEHHSNLLPWQNLCKNLGTILKVIPMNNNRTLPLSKKSKFLSVTYVSNATGHVNPIKDWIKQAKDHNMYTLIDAAQAAPHIGIDVQDLGCDFLVFSGHKIYGPTGTGVLYGKIELLDKMEPYQQGGGMVTSVSFKSSTFLPSPYRFEAGTPNIGGIIALKKAIEFTIKHREVSHKLIPYALKRLTSIPEINLYSSDSHSAIPIFSFTLEYAHPHDIGTILNQYGIAIRAGHMCAMPLLETLRIRSILRVSLGAYNSIHDIDALYDALIKSKGIFK